MIPVFVAAIFDEKPKQWGLRGDPYLWEEMKKAFSTTPLPISPEEFVKEFNSHFEKFTGMPLTREVRVYLPRYSHGGMSGGQVCGEFWIDKALPVLLERLKIAADSLLTEK